MVKAKTKKCALCSRQIKGERYILRIVCYSAYDGLEIKPWDLRKDFQKLIEDEVKKIEKLPKRKLMEEVAKWWEFTLCKSCAAKYRKNPLGNKKLKIKNPAPLSGAGRGDK